MTAFVYQHRVPWPDVDLAGIVYYPRFFSYFEMAELEWIRARGVGYEDLLRRLDVWLPRVAAHCNYHAPARLADLLGIEMHLERLGRTSFTLGYDAYRLPERAHLADGTIVIASVGRSNFKPVSVPGELRRMLEELRGGGGDGARQGSKGGKRKK